MVDNVPRELSSGGSIEFRPSEIPTHGLGAGVGRRMRSPVRSRPAWSLAALAFVTTRGLRRATHDGSAGSDGNAFAPSPDARASGSERRRHSDATRPVVRAFVGDQRGRSERRSADTEQLLAPERCRDARSVESLAPKARAAAKKASSAQDLLAPDYAR